MDFVVILIAIVVIAIFLFSRSKAHSRNTVEQLPYFKISTLLSPAELSFYHVLTIAVSDRYDVNTKVRLADVIAIQKGTSRSEWGKAFNKIKAKHLDFVLTTKETSEILCAIELDDASHSHDSRQGRDKFLEDVLRVSKLPLLRIPVNQTYQSQDIANKLSALLEPEIEIKTENADQGEVKIFITPESSVLEDELEKNRNCPRCGAQLIERKSSKGKYAGVIFWGCSNFPKCRYKAIPKDRV